MNQSVKIRSYNSTFKSPYEIPKCFTDARISLNLKSEVTPILSKGYEWIEPGGTGKPLLSSLSMPLVPSAKPMKVRFSNTYIRRLDFVLSFESINRVSMALLNGCSAKLLSKEKKEVSLLEDVFHDLAMSIPT